MSFGRADLAEVCWDCSRADTWPGVGHLCSSTLDAAELPVAPQTDLEGTGAGVNTFLGLGAGFVSATGAGAVAASEVDSPGAASAATEASVSGADEGSDFSEALGASFGELGEDAEAVTDSSADSLLGPCGLAATLAYEIDILPHVGLQFSRVCKCEVSQMILNELLKMENEVSS